MLQITEQLADGKRYTHNLHDLLLPSGQWCHKLTADDLRRELLKLKLPVEKHMGHQQLSVVFSRWQIDNRPKP
jgi:hypothetical protein